MSRRVDGTVTTHALAAHRTTLDRTAAAGESPSHAPGGTTAATPSPPPRTGRQLTYGTAPDGRSTARMPCGITAGTLAPPPQSAATGIPMLGHSAADRAIMDLAAAQHGVVTRQQLLAAGIPPDTVDRRIANKTLIRLHRGVYAVGLPVSARGRAMAALFACGSDAVVSHQTAAALRGIVPAGAPDDPAHVILARGDRRRQGIRIHRIRGIRSDEITMVDGIRQTTPARTLLDLAATLTARDLEKATVEALGSRLATPAELGQIARRHAGHRGSARLRALLGTSGTGVTRSTAERKLRALIRKSGLRLPETNAIVAGLEVDAVWRQERLIVEVDGRAFHSTSGRVAADRRRDFAFATAGYRVLRVTWHQLVHTPEALIVELTKALFGSADR